MAQEKSAEIIDLSASRAAASGDYAGAFLATARHGAGLDIGAVAAATKIRPEHIEAIEAGDAAGLPATPFAVGFVKVYAQYLGLDAQEIAAQFKREMTAARPVDEAPVASTIPVVDTSAGVKIASLIGILLIGAFAVWIALQVSGNSKGQSNDASSAGPKVTISQVRAEAPRPRVSDTNLPVVAIPPVASGGEAVPTGEIIEPATGAAVTDSLVGELSQGVPENGAIQTPPAEQTEALPQPADELPVRAVAAAQTPVAPIEQPVRSQPQRTPAPARVPDPVVVDARLVRSIGPDYPRRCERDAEALESVSVIFDVTAAGHPANTRVTGASNSCFEDAAVKAISKWRFNPRTVDGAPRPQSGVEATLNFRQ